ncbi:MAG TPA: 6-hydroxymethylpterin diphosphokinase MptE-like protein [Atribacteraceae bacterium]|nr:6-hydroxymethylpterin diphosphokinase MptE-like protein [Atribacteraceae bacterium]
MKKGRKNLYFRQSAKQTKPANAKTPGGLNIFQKNLDTLAATDPSLAKRIQNTPDNGRFRVVRNGLNALPTLQLSSGNFTYYNPADPMRDVKDQLESLKLRNTRLAVFLGFGLGYEALYYARHMSKEQQTTFFLIIEKEPEIFRAALKTLNLIPLLEIPQVKFIVGEEEKRLYPLLRQYLAEQSRFMFLKAMKPVYHTSALILNKEYYLNALKILRESAVHQILNFGDSPEDSLVGVRHMLANLGEIAGNPGVNLLFDKFCGKPAVVVATGPSLNKNKHLLKGLEKKALIIAADASLKILLDMGVKPHLVTSLERVPLTAELLKGFTPEETLDTYLAACPVVVPELYEAYPGPRCIVYRNFDHFRWLGIERGILDIKLSAGNMAFKVAEALGCDPIILIGQDLAFSREGTTHASGAVLGEKQDAPLAQKILEVPGNDGQPITTTETWYSFLKGYELDLAGYSGACINATEGGAFIQGTTVMSFQETIERYIREEFHPLAIIRKELSAFTVEDAERDLRQVLELSEKTVEDLTAIIKECKKGLESVRKHQDILHACLQEPERPPELRSQLAQIQREILEPKLSFAQKYRHTYQLYLMHVLQSFSIKFEMEMIAIPEKHDHRDQATAEILLQHEQWYSVIGELVKICMDVLVQGKEKLEEDVRGEKQEGRQNKYQDSLPPPINI